MVRGPERRVALDGFALPRALAQPEVRVDEERVRACEEGLRDVFRGPLMVFVCDRFPDIEGTVDVGRFDSTS